MLYAVEAVVSFSSANIHTLENCINRAVYRMKIDGYMLQRRVWPALNSLSIYVTFTAIVPERTQGRQKCEKNVLKWRTFNLTAWITGKRLKIDWNMLRGVWQALNPLSIHVKFIAIVPGAYPEEAKMMQGVGKSCNFRPISRYSICQGRNFTS